MPQFRAIAIVITIFLLWVSTFIQQDLENVMAYVFIFSFGILHGSNDISLLEVRDQSKASAQPYIKILAGYLLFIGLTALLFYALPTVGLLTFVLISAYHFGEEHWRDKLDQNSKIGRVFYLLYGLLVLFLLFQAHQLEVIELIGSITGVQLSENFLFWMPFVLLGTVILYGLLLMPADRPTLFNAQDLLYIVVFFVVFNATSLLWAFAIYFIIWHSLPSLMAQISHLYGDISHLNMMRYLRSSLGYWIISLIGIFGIYWFFSIDEQNFLPLFFPILAALTFPHVYVMTKMGPKNETD